MKKKLLHGKNSFVKIFLNLALDTDLKRILSNHIKIMIKDI